MQLLTTAALLSLADCFGIGLTRNGCPYSLTICTVSTVRTLVTGSASAKIHKLSPIALRVSSKTACLWTTRRTSGSWPSLWLWLRSSSSRGRTGASGSAKSARCWSPSALLGTWQCLWLATTSSTCLSGASSRSSTPNQIRALTIWFAILYVWFLFLGFYSVQSVCPRYCLNTGSVSSTATSSKRENVQLFCLHTLWYLGCW